MFIFTFDPVLLNVLYKLQLQALGINLVAVDHSNLGFWQRFLHLARATYLGKKRKEKRWKIPSSSCHSHLILRSTALHQHRLCIAELSTLLVFKVFGCCWVQLQQWVFDDPQRWVTRASCRLCARGSALHEWYLPPRLREHFMLIGAKGAVAFPSRAREWKGNGEKEKGNRGKEKVGIQK